MAKHEERKGADLIEEGKFPVPLGKAWRVGEKPHHLAKIGSVDYEGERIKVGRMQNDGWLEQFFTRPAPWGEDAEYRLTFLYQTTKNPSSYQIARNGEFGTETELPSSGNLEPVPLDFKPALITLDLEPAEGERELGIRFRYPQTSDEDSGTLDVYDVSVRLYLAPLELSGVMIDEQLFASTRPFYLCKGAMGAKAHKLSLQVADGNVWEGTEVALEGLEIGPPPADFACLPALNDPQMIDRPWALFIGSSMATDNFALQIQSKWDTDQEQLRILPFNVGDYRVEVAEVFAPDYDPIMNKQKVSVGLGVQSWYTQIKLEGCRMTFDGKEYFSDDRGTATYEFEPLVAGTHNVEVLIDSPYYASGNVKQVIPVKVLASDPWEDAQISLGGNAAYPLGEKNGYPHRGAHEYRIRVTAPVDSELLNYPVRLKWDGPTPEALKVTVEPPLAEYVAWKEGVVEWVLNCVDALEGEFHVGLQAQRLLDPSLQNMLSLAFNTYELGEHREANRMPVLDAGEVVRVKIQVLAAGTTEGVRGVLVNWLTPSGPLPTYTGLDGWAELIYKPEQAGSDKLTAQIRNRGDDEDALIEKAFNFTAVQSNPWTEQVELSFSPENLVPGVPLDFYCLRGRSLALHLKPKPGSQLLDKKIELSWRHDTDSGLATFTPPLNEPQTLTEAGVIWTMTAGEISGWVELDFKTDGLADHWELSGRLLSNDPLDDGVFVYDSTVLTPNGSYYPCLGAKHALEFLPNANSATTGMQVQLLNPDNQRPLGIDFVPYFGRDQFITVEGVKWAMDCTKAETAYTFELGVGLTKPMIGSARDFHLNIGHNRLKFSESRAPTILPVVDENEAAFVWHRVVSFYTDQPVHQVPVTYSFNDEETLVFSRHDGWTLFACKPKNVGGAVADASLLNRYNNETVSAEQVTVTALQADAWQRDTVIRPEESFEQSKLGVKTLFPRHGTVSDIRIAPDITTHPAENQYVRTGWSGTPFSVLGTSLSPSPGTPQLMLQTGVISTYFFGHERSGSFGLFIASANLLRLSPVNAMSLGPEPAEPPVARQEVASD